MKETISKKLEYLRTSVRELRKLEDTTAEELREDSLKRAAVERFFQTSIETVLDICSVIVADEGLERPDEYRKLIEELGEEAILDPDFSDSFADAAGFRNVLVHPYADVDVDKLEEHLHRLDDFDAFAEQIVSYLDAEE